MQNINPNQKVDVVDLTKNFATDSKLTKKDLSKYIQTLIGTNPLNTKDKKALASFVKTSKRIGKKNVYIPDHIANSSKVEANNIDERKTAVNNITDLIQNAILIEISPNTNKKGKPNVDNYLRFYVPVKINNDIFTIRIVAENNSSKNLFNVLNADIYDLIIDKKMPTSVYIPANTQSNIVKSTSNNIVANNSQNINPAQITIKDMLSNVEDADGNIYFQSAVTAGAETSAEISDAQKEWREKGADSKYFKKWFGDSKVVDENGQPLVVYHGTNADFDTFDYDKIGTNGTSEGVGFYFTDDIETAEGYKKQNGSLKKCYVSIQKPLGHDTHFLSYEDVKNIIQKTAELQSEEYEEDLKDSFVSNYADTYSMDFEYAVEATADMIYSEDKNDTDILGEIAYSAGSEFANKAVKLVTGYDGVITNGYNNEGKGGGNFYIPFTSEQIKSVDNLGTFDEGNANIYYQTEVNQKDDNAASRYSNYEDLVSDYSSTIEDVPNDYNINVLDDALKDLGIDKDHPQKIETPNGNVLVTDKTIEHIIDRKDDKTRYRSINKMFATLKNPTFVNVSENGGMYYFKIFKTNDGTKNQTVVVRTNELGEVVETTYPTKRDNNYFKKLKIGKTVYDIKNQRRKGDYNTAPVNNSITNNFANDNPERTGYVFQEPAQPNLFVENAAQNHNKGFVGIDLKGNRGLTDINRNLILIGTTGDVTTVLHESAHYFLNMLEELERVPDHSPKVDDALFAIRKTLKNDGTPFTRSQHEKFAKGFEHYIYTGNARSNIFKEIYEDIKNLLKNIYEFVQKGQYFTTGEGALTEEEMKNFNNVFDEIFKLENKTVKERVFAKVLALNEKEEDGFFKELTLFLSLFWRYKHLCPNS